jgi:tRNA/tmRNA/rRNA uracil-C5-methylase (TrmA/RlmC/RlmD family)
MNFADLLRQHADRRRIVLPSQQHPEPLVGLDYGLELDLKNTTLAQLWREARLPSRPEPIVAAPLPRGYRTTSKRRAVRLRAGLRLGFPGIAAADAGVAPSVLDAPSHLALFQELLVQLARPPLAPLVDVLNWAIVRGDGNALSLILNLRAFDAPIVRAAKRLGELLQASPAAPRALLLYLDPTDSEYYLEARRPTKALAFKRIYGPETLDLVVDGVRLKFPAVSFSQVNGPMVPVLTATARALLAPTPEHALLDLYCGYGLFSFTVGQGLAKVTSVDSDGPAIEAAKDNARALGRGGAVRCLAGSIDEELVTERLRPADRPELLLLDPPRGGTGPGVVAALAGREPERVVHLCCGVDELPREVASWTKQGFRLERVVPLDLFAGTANVEVFLLFVPVE